jgi:hypothetical protein
MLTIAASFDAFFESAQSADIFLTSPLLTKSPGSLESPLTKL